ESKGGTQRFSGTLLFFFSLPSSSLSSDDSALSTDQRDPSNELICAPFGVYCLYYNRSALNDPAVFVHDNCALPERLEVVVPVAAPRRRRAASLASVHTKVGGVAKVRLSLCDTRCRVFSG